MRAARLRASKFPKPVIWTFAPFLSSAAMIPLSSNRASIARPASAFDILVRMARAAVSSAYGLGLAAVNQRLPVFHGTRPGWIEVIAGVMFSGKSEELVRRVRRAVIARKHVQVFKSHLDARYAGLYTVSTHDGGTVEAAPVDSSEGVLRAVRPDTEVDAVDEVQFLADGIVAAANGLADRGVRIMLAGIDKIGRA